MYQSTHAQTEIGVSAHPVVPNRLLLVRIWRNFICIYAIELCEVVHDTVMGRRTETDFINSFVVEQGEQIGVHADVHARITEIAG